MRIHLLLLAAATLAPSTIAQTTQYYDLWPGATSFTSRGALGMSSGEVHQGFHKSVFRGLAQDGGSFGSVTNAKSLITSIRGVIQDQNCADQENYSWVVRKGDDLNGPMAGTAGLYGSITGLQTPPPSATTPNRICAWIVTATATVPIEFDSDEFVSVGCELAAAANWASNGQSCHTSFSIAAGTQPEAHRSWFQDNSRVPTTPRERIEHDWQIPSGTTVADHPGSGRSWRFSMGHAGAQLELGNDARYGMGGMFPFPSTSSAPLAYSARVSAGSAMSGQTPVAILAPLGYIPFGGYGKIGTGADIWVQSPAAIYFFGPAASASGVSVIPIAPFIPAAVKDIGNFPFQAAIANTTDFKVTNAQSIDP